MRIYNHEITVRRGESFTIDKIVQNRDGSPYIIGRPNENGVNYQISPYILLKIVSSLYEQKDRYVYRAWLSLNNSNSIYAYNNTVPVCIDDFTDINGVKLYQTGFEGMTGLPAGYINGEYKHYSSPFEAIFYTNYNTEKPIYKYYYYGQGFRDYQFKISLPIGREITKDWLEQTYHYSIDLVYGTPTSSKLNAILNSLGFTNEDYSDWTKQEKYDKISNLYPELVENVNLDFPLQDINTSYPILGTTKLTVLSDLKGGI